MEQQDGSDPQDQGTSPALTDEQARAAEAEGYGGEPISDSELGEVWTGTARDVVSDPAKDDSVGSDWSDEGGATPTGPATDSDPSNSDPSNSEPTD